MDQAPSYTRKKILIVEDSALQAELLRQTIAHEGHFVTVSNNGLEGLEKAQAIRPHLVVSDVYMPGLDGCELCARIKNDAELKDTPVILLTQMTKPEDIIKGLAAGADSYITKPFDSRHLLSKINYLLESPVEQYDCKRGSLEINIGDTNYTINADCKQILNVLLSTYENAFYQNRKLVEAELALKKLNEQLEQKVKEKTAALTAEISERRQAETALRNTNEFLLKVMDTTTNAIYALDLEGNFTMLNHQCTVISGYEFFDLIGRPFWACFVPDLLPELNELFHSVTTLGHTVSGFKSEIIRKDGSRRSITINAAPLVQNDKITGVVGTAEDITERKRLEEQFYKSQRLEAIGRLAGGVAHDFNNYLNAIIGFSELSMSETGRESGIYGNLETIHSSALKAADICRQLLTFSCKQVVEPRSVNINNIITGIDRMLKRLIGDNIKLDTVLDPDLGSIRADPTHIEQVIVNLAVNARDAMPGGGTIEIRTANAGAAGDNGRNNCQAAASRLVMVSVRDSGTGMPESVKRHIFEPFFTTKEEGKGTGLGLATVYGIVKHNGGHINVASEEGRGAEFTIYLPEHSEKTVCSGVGTEAG